MNNRKTLALPKDKLIIAGPCSVESEEQIHTIAKSISEDKSAHMLRGGTWKARTRPGGFEGHGKLAVKWLAEAGRTYNIPVITEVATAHHVEEALKQGLTALWIGSRSVGSPFVVEEIAEALRGCNIQVLIKNPTHPELSLWIGAIERLSNKNIPNIMAIHRGFSTNWKSMYRNEPKWEIALELKLLFPELPIIVDPSHICGNSDYILQLSDYAMNLPFDGLMIETHNNPQEALTDAKQQITPAELRNILSEIFNKEKPKVNSLDQTIILKEFLKDITFTNNLLKQLKANTVKELGEFKEKQN